MQKTLYFVVSAMLILSAQAFASDKKSAVDVLVETNKGNFIVRLAPEKAPETVKNFLSYVDQGFYSNTIFHRVIDSFVVQGGGFEPGMKLKSTGTPVKNESKNGLKNTRGTIAMARKQHPDSATSQFYINLIPNPMLDNSPGRAGYTVFGSVVEGMAVVDEIAKVATGQKGPYHDTPEEDVVIKSISRHKSDDAKEPYVLGRDYSLLEKAVKTKSPEKIEVVELFSYGCPRCYAIEPLLDRWKAQQSNDVDYINLPAVWNKPMEVYARAFFAAKEMGVLDKIHNALFETIIGKQNNIGSVDDLADFFKQHGQDPVKFKKLYQSKSVDASIRSVEARVKAYKLAGVPEVVVNGKYRVDRMRAGGEANMLQVVDFLVEKERKLLTKNNN